MSSTEGTPAPNTPDIGVRAVIALPFLELTGSYSPDDDVMKTLPSLVGKVSEQFDSALSPETPFEFVDLKFYPGECQASFVIFNAIMS